MFFLLRLCCATLSAYIFIFFMPDPPYQLFLLSPDEDLSWYFDVVDRIKLIAGALWMASWAFLEFRSFRRSGQRVPRLLTHLRYGPIVILVFSIAMITAFDFMLIQYSRWEIVRYIHSDSPVNERPSLNLYNNYRHWCGNGIAARRYHLYGDTPVAYIDAPDPATRARALQASIFVYDWINQPNDGPAIDALTKASMDPDPMVRELAAEFSADLYYDGVIGMPAEK